MRYLINFTILITFLYSESLKIGSSMPNGDINMKDISGIYMSLNSLKNSNGMLVIFSCNSCPWVIKWQNRYNEIKNICLENGIGFTLINSNSSRRSGVESYDRMLEHAKKYNYTFPYMIDKSSKLAYAFKAKKTPEVFLFDKNSILVYKGAIDDNAKSMESVKNKYLINSLNALGNNMNLLLSETKALGCSIKY